MATRVHILGVRHHGPGSARSVLRTLDELRPDCVLIEGPPDGDGLIADAAKADMTPPVAILVYDSAEPASAVYYPFAEFSPEWQAMRWAIGRGVAVRFMDLPQAHRMAVRAERLKAIAEQVEAANRPNPEGISENDHGPAEPDADSSAAGTVSPPTTPAVTFEPDPLGQLARAAGFDDGERWWEHVVEHRHGEGLELFAAIRDAMAELRAKPSFGEAGSSSAADVSPLVHRPFADADEPLREAWMRRTIRAAKTEGFATIAVVSGAWHAPALDVESREFPKKADDELLKKLPKVKTTATWVPWTYDHLTFASGYGAGVASPGWYHHLWQGHDHVLAAWMAKVAGLLRARDVDCSSAHVIEAVRLGETLAALRGRPLADLSDVADATRSVFCTESDAAMGLIARELLVGHRLGEVPADTPMVPLQQDLTTLQKRLRLKAEALEKPINLDLRNDTDRQRSVLLHRLRLLDVGWGTPDDGRGGGKGTFHERWTLRWDPSFAVRLIEAGRLGNTIEAAAGASLARAAAETRDLKSLAARLQDAMLADLGDAAAALVRHIEDVAAVATDVTLLMQTVPPLTSLVRYGNVRRTDEGMVRHIIDGILPRIAAGLGPAVASLNDEAAAIMHEQVVATHAAIAQLDVERHTADWLDALARVLDHDTVQGLIRGRCARLLLDASRIDAAEVARRLGLSLSRGADPGQGARWLEGFLGSSGLLLIHDPKLLDIIDAWLREIPAEAFDELLPLLRRTFSAFPTAERRQVGQLLAKGPGATRAGGDGETRLNAVRAERALPLLRFILSGT